MIVAVTGTRNGFYPNQESHFRRFLLTYGKEIRYVVHGMCKGVDARAHQLVRELLPGVHIKGRPGLGGRGPSPFSVPLDVDTLMPPRLHLDRNMQMVRECDIVLAYPEIGKRRGGTWFTIRYAEKQGKRCIVTAGELVATCDPS